MGYLLRYNRTSSLNLLCFGNETEFDLQVGEELARCPYNGVVWGLNGGNLIGCPPILNFGTQEQRMEYLPRVFRGEIRFCLAVTEPGGEIHERHCTFPVN